MNPLLQQFLSEGRDMLEGIGAKLMQLEEAPADQDLMGELFRLVHTLKGNSGLFVFPEMTRVLHAGEDLMDAVRNGDVPYSRELADCLLSAMDFVSALCDEIEADGALGTSHAAAASDLARSLRDLHATPTNREASLGEAAPATANGAFGGQAEEGSAWNLGQIPEAARIEAYGLATEAGLTLVTYTPTEGCFYQGDDPFFQARQTPELVWGAVGATEPWPSLESLDAYRCVLDFHLLSLASREELTEHFRYVLDQIQFTPIAPLALVLPQGDPNGGPVYEDFVADTLGYLQARDLDALARAAQSLLELSNPDLWLSSALRWLLAILHKDPENFAALRTVIETLNSLEAPAWSALAVEPEAENRAQTDPEPIPLAVGLLDRNYVDTAMGIITTQRMILALTDRPTWQSGRIQAAVISVCACLKATGQAFAPEPLASALACALANQDGTPLLTWLDDLLAQPSTSTRLETVAPTVIPPPLQPAQGTPPEGEAKFGRRAEDTLAAPKSLKVDQAKIDRLMNLIGEMVVSKNALPYLASRAETVFGVRELSREIKAQYAVINRIAEEMQDAIMQVRMMPVSFVFQRFPRLVRDTSRKLGKEVNLVLVGEDTEADKNIIEALGDPLVHIVRNSLDHGFESPEVRRAAGKPAAGTLTLRASQESDRVLIEIQDDGKGIDPAVIKRKAYERGILDEAALARISDQDAINLVFAAGLSTAEEISDLSGRGVGMDVVRAAVEKVNGSVHLDSVLGQGTRLCLSLPLSMAVTNVMIVEADGQRFGVPMDHVIETVRVPASRIRTIKKSQATVLRGRIVALKTLNASLGLTSAPKANADGELAILVVRQGNEPVGLLVDRFHETVDVILKPMTGVLAGLSTYSGSALMGDGSVLMVLNIKEIL